MTAPTFPQPPSPTTIEDLLPIIRRDLPQHLVGLTQCPPECPIGGWTATLSRSVIGQPDLMAEWGSHGPTPFEALRAAYILVLETTHEGEQA